MHIFADGLTKVTFANNTLRINLYQEGPDNTPVDAGTLIIPVSQAANFINGLASNLTALNEQMQAQIRQNQGEPQ